ncbi:MAG: hypothetical protein HYR55_01135 [Acidobacteria bacterium]|nr:hypothetical protein [Acidobacteriota bacterium]
MQQALLLLADGAFKLFVYLALSAQRQSGRLSFRHPDLARALGKSRRSISTYLEELGRQQVCRVRPAANQHQTGEIEIQDAFWPYVKTGGCPAPDPEAAYVEQVQRWFLAYPVVRSAFGAADRQLAGALYRRGVSLPHVERALLLGIARKYTAQLNGQGQGTIASLSYFAPLLEEVAGLSVSEDYWAYLRQYVERAQGQGKEPRARVQPAHENKRLGKAEGTG